MYKGLTRKIWRCKRNKGECHNHCIGEEKLIELLNGIDFDLLEKAFLKENGEIEIHYKTRYYPIFQNQTNESIG